MSSKAYPPRKTNLDRYINGFFLCGFSLVEIASQCGVTPQAVENALKRFDRKAYELERLRRKRENESRRREKDRERKKTPAARERDRLRKQRKRQEAKNLYTYDVKDVLRDKEVVELMRRAINENENLRDKWIFTRYIPDGLPEHPLPVYTRKNIENTTPREAKAKADYEMRQAAKNMAGVPGVEVLKIREALNFGDYRKAYLLAENAVTGAGWINPSALTKDVLAGRVKIYDRNKVKEIQKEVLLDAQKMCIVADAPAIKDLSKKEKLTIISLWEKQTRRFEKEFRTAVISPKKGGIQKVVG